MRDVAAEAEELRENDIEDGKHEKWPQKRPEVAKDGTLIAELEIGLRELFEEDAVAFVPDFWYIHISYYII